MLEWPDLIRMIQDLKPYLVPVVFVYDNDGSYYIPIDKNLNRAQNLLKRVRNEANPMMPCSQMNILKNGRNFILL
jgi:hypothetical protein